MMKNKTLVLLSYLFFVPILYIILTPKRHDPYCGFQAGQAFLLWLIFFLLYITIIEIRYNTIVVVSLWAVVAACGISAFLNEGFKVSLIGDMVEKL